jgi:hypothetical protein
MIGVLERHSVDLLDVIIARIGILKENSVKQESSTILILVTFGNLMTDFQEKIRRIIQGPTNNDNWCVGIPRLSPEGDCCYLCKEIVPIYMSLDDGGYCKIHSKIKMNRNQMIICRCPDFE